MALKLTELKLAEFKTCLPQMVAQLRSLLLIALVSLALTGCVEDRVGIQFDSPQGGQITQHLHLDNQMASAQGWLSGLERRARKLGAMVDRGDRSSLDLALPFTSAADLEQKFNSLFTAQETDSSLPNFTSHLQVKTNNLLLLERRRLIYDLDLSSLAIQGNDGNLLLDPGEGLDVAFGVSGPWGANKGRRPQGSFSPEAHREGGELLWQLEPGRVNHIEAIVWMPSPIGLGALAIVGLVIGGRYLTQKQPKP
ncbi:MAG: DUF3153 domain-containing protein [Alkalinema sp. RU_4_3]|nr:DUF3153 domain-containing protein [Alkalinema sp. RU_4_3]